VPKVDSKKFFQEQSAHSRVKADVVFKYVVAWLRIVAAAQARWRKGTFPQAAYLELFSGPGSYEDGNRSTPLLIMQEVCADPRLRQWLRAFFNDENQAFVESLKQEVNLIPNVSLLRHALEYRSETASVKLFESLHIPLHIPVFVFLDQFGYSDVTPQLISRIFSHQMADCVFFIRTSRFIGAITNKKVASTVDRVFGQDVLNDLRDAFGSNRLGKEELVLNKLKEIMLRAGAKYFQAFPFRINESNSSRHHLIYLGKHERGLSLMKEIMGKASSRQFDGVPVMGFSEISSGPTLFESDLIPSLQRDLITVFAGKELSVGQVFSAHHPSSTQFILRNYQEALRRLEDEGKISTSPPAARRPKRNDRVTMGESVKISFPGKELK
jgi:three-Cys-motif partner protein